LQETLTAEQRKNNKQFVAPFRKEVINDNGDKLIYVCEQNSLIILNAYFKHEKTHHFIWHQDTLELNSITDYIIARQISGLKFQDVRILRGMTVGSNHYLANAEVLFSYGKDNTNETKDTITDCTGRLLQSPLYNIDSLRDESTSFFIQEEIR
jgi:hypothetical protein